MDRIAHFTRLIEQQPENELFHFSLAQALLASGRGREAEPHFSFCVKAKADWMMPRIALGKLLLQLGRPTEAKPFLEEALRLAIDQNHESPEAELRSLLAELD